MCPSMGISKGTGNLGSCMSQDWQLELDKSGTRDVLLMAVIISLNQSRDSSPVLHLDWRQEKHSWGLPISLPS